MGIVLLALLFDLATAGTVNIDGAIRIIGFLAAFFLLAPIAAKHTSILLSRFQSLSETPGLIPTMIVAMILALAGLADKIGAPDIIGGFAAGLALSRRFFLPFGLALTVDDEFSDFISDQMRPIVRLFTPFS